MSDPTGTEHMAPANKAIFATSAVQVHDITESDLYLDCHRCDRLDGPAFRLRAAHPLQPGRCEFIVDPAFEPVVVEVPLPKLPEPADVRRRDDLCTRGWRRLGGLQQLAAFRSPIIPLPEVLAAAASVGAVIVRSDRETTLEKSLNKHCLAHSWCPRG